MDVARLAGVSQSAVSRALTPGASISAKAKMKVEEAAERLGYTPNVFARNLITRRTDIIGVVMGDVTNPFHAEVLRALGDRLQEAGRRVLFTTTPAAVLPDDAIRQLLEYQPAGIIVTTVALSPRMAELCAAGGTPVMMLNRRAPRAGAGLIRCDNAAGGRTVARLLLDAGHARPAFIGGGADGPGSRERGTGFAREVAERGLPPPPVEDGGFTYEGGFAAALRLFRASPRPDALFCGSDLMALGAIDALRRELGMRVPEDVSVIGFDDIAAARWAGYDLTTIRQPVEEMVDAAIAAVMAGIADPSAVLPRRQIPGRLVARGSARLPTTERD